MSINLKELKQRSEEPSYEESEVREKKDLLSFLHKEIKWGRKGFSLSKKENFYAELEMLLGSGLDIKTSFSILVREQGNETDRRFYQGIYDRLIDGSNLSDSMNRTGKISLHEYYSLKIGEETGKILEVLTDLSTYFEERLKQKRQMVSTFSYPVLVIVVAFAVVLFMMNFIVPMFQDVFKRFNGQLPALTCFVMNLSHTLTHYFWLYTGLLAACCFSVWSVRKTLAFRRISSKMLLKIPVVNKLIKKFYMARFCQSMNLMISAHIPLITALDLVSKMIGFYPYEKALKKMGDDVMNGKLLYESMTGQNLFDMKLVSLTRVGEEVNRLSDIYSKLNRQYADELQHEVVVLNSMLEPVLIILIGLMVAVILVSMYLPMFQMGNSIMG